MSKARGKDNIYLSKQNGVCVCFVVLTSEHNETLDAEKHGSSVSPAASERTSCAAILIMLNLCVTLLVTWTTRLASVI